MCNLYSITTNQPAIAALFRVNQYVGNLPPMPGVFAARAMGRSQSAAAAVAG
jgi:hypothetical protein